MPESIFATEHGVPRAEIPESCIESAEYIIQCISQNKILPWKEGAARTPNVIAEFGDGVKFNITTEANFHKNPSCVGLKDFPFGAPPDIGQGLILLNKTSGDQHFNMHLGGVVATGRGRVYISDVSEDGKVKMVLTWPCKMLRSAQEFRGSDYPADKFALGILYPKP